MIVIGFRCWTDDIRSDLNLERVLVGPGNRTHLDKLVALAPVHSRDRIAKFLAPLLEGKEVRRAGTYDHDQKFLVWWKHCEIV